MLGCAGRIIAAGAGLIGTALGAGVAGCSGGTLTVGAPGVVELLGNGGTLTDGVGADGWSGGTVVVGEAVDESGGSGALSIAAES